MYAAHQDMQLSASTLDPYGSVQGQYYQQSGFNSGSIAFTANSVSNEMAPFYVSSREDLPHTPYHREATRSDSTDEREYPGVNAEPTLEADQAANGWVWDFARRRWVYAVDTGE